MLFDNSRCEQDVDSAFTGEFYPLELPVEAPIKPMIRLCENRESSFVKRLLIRAWPVPGDIACHMEIFFARTILLRIIDLFNRRLIWTPHHLVTFADKLTEICQY